MSEDISRKDRHHTNTVKETERLFEKLDTLMDDQETILARIRQLVVVAARKEGKLYGDK